MTAKQSEMGIVTITSRIERNVSRCAQMPGPSSHAKQTQKHYHMCLNRIYADRWSCGICDFMLKVFATFEVDKG